MAIEFKLSDLTSRKVRSDIGSRLINTGLDSQKNDNGVISFLVNGALQLGGFLVKAIFQGGAFTWSTLFGWFVNTTQFIWNFNFNATDKDLDSQIKSRLTALAAQTGGVLGNALGYLACGVLPGAVIFSFNEPLGAYVLKNVIEEGTEEFIENLTGLIKQAFSLGTQVIMAWSFKNARKLIKANARYISAIFGKNSKQFEKIVKAWGEEGSKPWSFAIATEETIEKLGNGTLGQFTEELVEEFAEACIEAGYVVANSVDTFLAQDMLNKKQNPILGNERFVEITPNREYPENKIVLGGNEELLKPVIIQTLATDQVLGERDLGIIYGTDNNQPVRSEKPEVVLKFYQHKEDRVIGTDKNGKTISDPEAVRMRISFRLMNKSEADFATDAYIKQLALKIYQELATPPFRITKGKELYTYHDWAKGYSLNLWVNNQAEARRTVGKILDIQGHKIDDDKLRLGSKPVNGRKTKERKTVLGKVVDVPVVGGKEGTVTFSHAYLNIGNGTDPINLIDLTGRKRNVIYKP